LVAAIINFFCPPSERRAVGKLHLQFKFATDRQY
jgi:hypothetical protein